MEPTSFSVKLIAFLSGFSGLTAYGAILGILFICGLGVPIPEDITLVSAGVLAALGNISLTGAYIAGFVGVLVGDTLLFFLGKFYGYKVFTLPLMRKIFTEKRIELARSRVLSNSKFICFTARFLPGLRAPIYLTAGILGVKPLVFLALDAAAALISVPIWVYLGYYFGENMDSLLNKVGQFQGYILGGILFAVSLYFIVFRRKKLSNKSKRN